MFDYVVHELGYTAAAAWRRIKAMRLCSQTRGARELLQDGSLNLSNAAQVQNLFERSDRSRGRAPGGDGAGGGLGGVQRNDGASGEPGPAAPTHGGDGDPAPAPAPAGGPVLDAAAREELVRQAAGKSTREVQQMLAEVAPELAQPSDRVRALGGGRWELKATIDAECRHGLEKLLMLLSHTDPHLTLGALVARLVRDGLDRYDPARPPRSRRTGGRGSADGAGSASTPARRDTGSVARTVVGANGSDVERQNEVERDARSWTADRDGLSGASAPKRHAPIECDNTKSAAVPDGGRRTDLAPPRHAEAEHRGTKSAPARNGGGRAISAAKRDTEAERGSAALVAAAGSGAYATSAAREDAQAELGSTKSAAVRGTARRADSEASRSEAERCSTLPAVVPNSGGLAVSAAKRVGQDEGGYVEEAARSGAAAVRAPGRRRETKHAGGQSKAPGGGGRIASLAKRRGRIDGDGRDAGVGGVLADTLRRLIHCQPRPHRFD
ncbi:MAG: hypothetical protein OXH96_05575, partial [Spirochaetaceae bacterium]|nr:hypothetical protein [Spirochaetaceae bacterium]